MSWSVVKDIRKIYSGLSADDIRGAAYRPVRVGLMASSEDGFLAIEETLSPASLGREARLEALSSTIRLGAGTPENLDFILCEPGLVLPPNGYAFDAALPAVAFKRISKDKSEIETALARVFPGFRQAVADQIIVRISQENALFSIVTALPNVIPNLIELPWAIGECATDTAFLTMNQVRMALTLAAAAGRPVGYMEQKIELGTIAGAAFGWRALARELAGKIPLGGGLIPKAAIAFAGTYLAGRTIEKLHRTGLAMSREEKKAVYNDAYQEGKRTAKELAGTIQKG